MSGLVLKVTQIEPRLPTKFFHDPVHLARASEGFCPFREHLNTDDSNAIPVEPRPDGLVFCPIDNVLMRWEWTQE